MGFFKGGWKIDQTLDEDKLKILSRKQSGNY